MLRVCTKTLPLSLIPEIGASLGRIFRDSDWLRDGPMRRIGPPWGIFGQESLQIPPAERSPGSTLGLGPLLDIQTFGGRRRRQFEPRYARVEPPPAPTASGPISNIGPRPRADPRIFALTASATTSSQTSVPRTHQPFAAYFTIHADPPIASGQVQRLEQGALRQRIQLACASTIHPNG